MKFNVKSVLKFLNSNDHVDKRGFLLKRGEVNKGWQKRWFVLKGNMLFYFHNCHDYEPIGLIILEGCSINLCATDTTIFSITFKFEASRTYHLCAENEEVCLAWVNSLQRSSYGYLKAQVDRIQDQIQALELRKCLSADQIMMMGCRDGSTSRANSTNSIPQQFAKSPKIKHGNRALSSPRALRRKLKNTESKSSPGKLRKNKDTTGAGASGCSSNTTIAPCRSFRQMHHDFAPGMPVIFPNYPSNSYISTDNVIDSLSSVKVSDS